MKPEPFVGTEPRSNQTTGPVGLLIVHGFTGTPASMRPIADAADRADLPFEQPLLSGHGTTIADMVDLGWQRWVDDVSGAAERLSARVDRLVLCGQSMGASLVLQAALDMGPNAVAGIVCINPLTQPRSSEELEMIDELIADGIEVVPGGDSDIADPDAHDVGYSGTPLRSIRSVLVDGIEPLSRRYAELTAPLLLFTSRQDHVVDPADSDYLARHYGGAVDHRWLERSYHVAAIDFDHSEVVGGTIEFVRECLP